MDFQEKKSLNPKIIIALIALVLLAPVIIYFIIKYPVILMLGGVFLLMLAYTWLKKKGVID